MKRIGIKNIVVGITLLLVSLSGYAQKIIPTLSIHQGNVKIVFQYADLEVSTKSNVMYFWTKYREIHHTEGGYSGQLLHGDYKEYFISGQLKVSGWFKKGAKTGEWIHWFENGKRQSNFNWKNGLKNGKYKIYYQNGKIKEEGYYRNDNLEGVIYQYDEKESRQRLRFKHGVQVDRAFEKTEKKKLTEKKKKDRLEKKEISKTKRIKKREDKQIRRLEKEEAKKTAQEPLGIKGFWLNVQGWFNNLGNKNKKTE